MIHFKPAKLLFAAIGMGVAFLFKEGHAFVHPTMAYRALSPDFRLSTSHLNVMSGRNATADKFDNIEEFAETGRANQEQVQIRKLSYSYIQRIIDVSCPYYKLESKIQADTRLAAGLNKKDCGSPATEMMPVGFCCVVDPEMATGR